MKRYLFYISQLYSFAIVRPLQEAIWNRGDEAAWFLEHPAQLATYLRPNEKRLSTVAEVKAYNPCAVFVPGNVVPDFFPGIKVEIFHGFHAHKRSRQKGHFRIRNFFDLYCTQGPDTTEPFQRLAEKHGFFEVVETGWPKMDPLFLANAQPVEKKRQPIILFTSTFTAKLSAAPVLFETIKSLVKGGQWKWLINFHPKMDSSVVALYKAIQDENLQYMETDNIIPLLQTADIMISDTSSVLSEFLLLYKPVVTMNNRQPGPHLLNITNPEKLRETVEHGLTCPAALTEEIKLYADRIHPYRDGLSSVRVLDATDAFIRNGRAHLKRKPLNIFRRMKIRKQLGYFRF